MRCVPGDLAEVLPAPFRVSDLTGQIVLVHKLVVGPVRFRLPDGTDAVVTRALTLWLVEFVEPVLLPTTGGGTIRSCWGMLGDQYLRPIRPGREPAAFKISTEA